MGMIFFFIQVIMLLEYFLMGNRFFIVKYEIFYVCFFCGVLLFWGIGIMGVVCVIVVWIEVYGLIVVRRLSC